MFVILSSRILLALNDLVWCLSPLVVWQKFLLMVLLLCLASSGCFWFCLLHLLFVNFSHCGHPDIFISIYWRLSEFFVNNCACSFEVYTFLLICDVYGILSSSSACGLSNGIYWDLSVRYDLKPQRALNQDRSKMVLSAPARRCPVSWSHWRRNHDEDVVIKIVVWHGWFNVACVLVWFIPRCQHEALIICIAFYLYCCSWLLTVFTYWHIWYCGLTSVSSFKPI